MKVKEGIVMNHKREYPWNLIEKKCPWCLSIDIDINADGLYQIECQECGSRGPADHTKERAIEHWNKGVKS